MLYNDVVKELDEKILVFFFFYFVHPGGQFYVHEVFKEFSARTLKFLVISAYQDHECDLDNIQNHVL